MLKMETGWKPVLHDGTSLNLNNCWWKTHKAFSGAGGRKWCR
jgi:hypothetical protein